MTKNDKKKDKNSMQLITVAKNESPYYLSISIY